MKQPKTVQKSEHKPTDRRKPKASSMASFFAMSIVKLKALVGISLASTAMLFLVACADVNFSKDESINQCQNSGIDCVPVNGLDHFNYTMLLTGGQVDVLFVVDNSGSMSFEHQKIAQRFHNFLSKLDERRLDYRIAITTTDIEAKDNGPREINQNGALQNGKLIPFNNGSLFLTAQAPDRETLFAQAIQRLETLKCDAFLKDAVQKEIADGPALYRETLNFQAGFYENCPSSDERAIYAASKTISENTKNWIRPNAHLALIIVSDENNRSFGRTDKGFSYSLKALDMPDNLINQVQSSFNGAKTFQTHAIVVENEQCSREQYAQMNNFLISANGSNIGTSYMELAQKTQGVIGSVCADDYGSQLGEIGSTIVRQVNTLGLACANPKDLEVSFSKPNGLSWAVSGRQVLILGDIPKALDVTLKYSCPSL